MNLKTLVVGLIFSLLNFAAYAQHTFEKDGVIHQYLTYDDMDPVIEDLANKITSQEIKFIGIVIITRGGLHAGNLLARKLGIKKIETVGLESYDDEDNQQKAIKVIKSLELENEGEGWLIVDDLADKGDTFKYMQTNFPKAMRSCLYVKPAGKGMAHFYATEVTQNTWLTFAYEKTLEEFFENK